MADEPISAYRYPTTALLGDYARAGIGLLFSLGPLGVTAPLPAVTGALGALGALFLAYAGRTVIRHCTVIRLSDKAIEASGPLGTRIEWSELRGYSLRYFSTKRDRTGGWMQLKLKARRRALRIDSSIDGFDTILGDTARAARQAGVVLDANSAENLRARGIRPAFPE